MYSRLNNLSRKMGRLSPLRDMPRVKELTISWIGARSQISRLISNTNPSAHWYRQVSVLHPFAGYHTPSSQ